MTATVEPARRIFLLGSERSGTNLLRVLLGNHTAVSAPAPIHLLDVLKDKPHLFHPYDAERIEALVERIGTYVNHDFSDWKLAIDGAAFHARYRPTSLLDVLDGVYTEKARHDGKPAYFCKDNHLHAYALALRARFPDARFVYIHRDPRDQVSSWLEHRFHLHSAHQAAKKWRREQEACLALARVWGLPLVPVKYEELIADTPGVMARVLETLGLPVEDACFQTSGKNAEAKKHALWKNLDKPVMRDNSGNYRTKLSAEDVEVVETLCRREMEALGYALDTPAAWRSDRRWKLREKLRVYLSKRRYRATEGLALIRDKNALAEALFR